MAAQSLALAEITVDPAIQQRQAVDPDLVAEYAETISTWQHTAPLTVFRDEAGVHWLADGFHRHAAAVQADLAVVHVELRTGTKRDAIVHSLSANARHGQRRTAADIQKSYETAVSLGLCDAADTAAVARLLACSERHARDLTAEARAQAKETQRAMILRHVDQGLSQREVSQLLGVSLGSVNAAVQNRHGSKIEHRAEEEAAMLGDMPSGLGSVAGQNRDHLSDWQRALLARLDAQAALNGRAGVVEALQIWMEQSV